MKPLSLAICLALLTACYLTQFTVATATRKTEPTRFTVRVENISNPEGMAFRTVKNFRLRYHPACLF